MFSNVFKLAKAVFLRLMFALFPVGLFISVVREFDLSMGVTFLLLIPVLAFEGWLVFKHLLPGMGDLVTKTLYSSNITTDEEDLLQKAHGLINTGNPDAALKLLQQYRQENPKLVRSWLMESGLLSDLRRYAESAKLLETALESRRWRKEDRALFLYKIGRIYESYLGDPHQAREYWQTAANKYPRTAYGKAAWQKL